MCPGCAYLMVKYSVCLIGMAVVARHHLSVLAFVWLLFLLLPVKMTTTEHVHFLSPNQAHYMVLPVRCRWKGGTH